MNASWAESVTALPLDDLLIALDERLRAIATLPEAERGSGLGEAYHVVSLIDLTTLTTKQRSHVHVMAARLLELMGIPMDEDE
jgi:hypothetical protein